MTGILNPRVSRSRTLRGIDPNTAFTLLLAAGIGAGVMYLLDPARGRRRRRLIADKVTSVVHRTSDMLTATGRDVAIGARAVVAEARSRFTGDAAEDAVICARVRAELGKVISYPSAIEVDVDDRTVFLWGVIPEHEADDLLAYVASVRGVHDVEDRLTRRISATKGHAPWGPVISSPPS